MIIVWITIIFVTIVVISLLAWFLWSITHKGSSGPSGSSGSTGQTGGQTGSSGNTSSVGPSGPTGSSGSSGPAIGPTGPSGPTSPVGPTSPGATVLGGPKMLQNQNQMCLGIGPVNGNSNRIVEVDCGLNGPLWTYMSDNTLSTSPGLCLSTLSKTPNDGDPLFAIDCRANIGLNQWSVPFGPNAGPDTIKQNGSFFNFMTFSAADNSYHFTKSTGSTTVTTDDYWIPL